jgi:hypothetical protein
MRRTLGEIIITILMAAVAVVVASSSLQEVEAFLRQEKLLKLRELFVTVLLMNLQLGLQSS